MQVYISYVARACLFTTVFSQLSISTADYLSHPIQIACVETKCELHTLLDIITQVGLQYLEVAVVFLRVVGE